MVSPNSVRPVRVTLELCDPLRHDEDDPKECRILVDLLIDASGGVPKKGNLYFGAYGSIKGRFHPFCLHNSEVIYSSEDAAGYGLNILEKTIEVGESVTYVTHGEERTYRIAHVTDLI